MVAHIVILVFKKLEQGDCQEFKTSLGYLVSYRPD